MKSSAHRRHTDCQRLPYSTGNNEYATGNNKYSAENNEYPIWSNEYPIGINQYSARTSGYFTGSNECPTVRITFIRLQFRYFR